MFNTKEKKERALGVKLFLKGERCASPKCAMVRRPYRPGFHGKGRVSFSENKMQLQEKQKIKYTYGIREAQMENVFTQAARKKGGIIGSEIMTLLERRLDNVVYRLGLAASRSVARQLVGHGHFLVNGRKVTVPSRLVSVGETVSIRPQSLDHPLFRDLETTLKKVEAPVWLLLDAAKKEGKVLSLPKDFEMPFDINLIVDYYSK